MRSARRRQTRPQYVGVGPRARLVTARPHIGHLATVRPSQKWKTEMTAMGERETVVNSVVLSPVVAVLRRSLLSRSRDSVDGEPSHANPNATRLPTRPRSSRGKGRPAKSRPEGRCGHACALGRGTIAGVLVGSAAPGMDGGSCRPPPVRRHPGPGRVGASFGHEPAKARGVFRVGTNSRRHVASAPPYRG